MHKLNRDKTMFFLCDMQEVFRKLVFNSQILINNSKYLTNISNNLNIPLLVTEHNKKTFGSTLPELTSIFNKDVSIFQKMQFSMLTDEVKKHLDSKKTENIILYGIETHICILQTSLDLVKNGYNVFLVADATSSQRAYDREIALKNLSNQKNLHLTTTESIFFELLGTSDSKEFKDNLKIIKEFIPNKDMNYNWKY